MHILNSECMKRKFLLTGQIDKTIYSLQSILNLNTNLNCNVVTQICQPYILKRKQTKTKHIDQNFLSGGIFYSGDIFDGENWASLRTYISYR